MTLVILISIVSGLAPGFFRRRRGQATRSLEDPTNTTSGRKTGEHKKLGFFVDVNFESLDFSEENTKFLDFQ